LVCGGLFQGSDRFQGSCYLARGGSK
jgi:hypothetical protein